LGPVYFCEGGSGVCRLAFQENAAHRVVFHALLVQFVNAAVNHQTIELPPLSFAAAVSRQAAALISEDLRQLGIAAREDSCDGFVQQIEAAA
jgi:hypothetical protein